MGTIASQFATAFRDFAANGIASSGAHEVNKEDVRAIGPLIEAALGAVSLASVDVLKDTRANLNADLAHPADAVALVYADATDANNELYIKVGASGSGSWNSSNILHSILSSLAASELQPIADEATAAKEAAEAALLALQPVATLLLTGAAIAADTIYVADRSIVTDAAFSKFHARIVGGTGTVSVAIIVGGTLAHGPVTVPVGGLTEEVDIDAPVGADIEVSIGPVITGTPTALFVKLGGPSS